MYANPPMYAHPSQPVIQNPGAAASHFPQGEPPVWAQSESPAWTLGEPPMWAYGEPPILEFKSVTKSYGKTCAIDNISLAIPRGRIVGLVGPNGSGKSTLIKLAAGLMHPQSGEVLVGGKSPGADTKALVSYLPERPYFAARTKVSEAIRIFSDFYRDFDQTVALDMLAHFGVALDTSFSEMSKGTREKVQLVLVMARKASLYLLDEPIGGVDPLTREFILDSIIARYHREASVVISTHLVVDVERILDDFILLSYGKSVAYAPLSAIRENYGLSLDEYFRKVLQ